MHLKKQHIFLIVINCILLGLPVVSKAVVTITTQPSSLTAISGEANITFSVTATGSNVGYEWRVDTNNSNTFRTITDNGIYRNSNSNTLTITFVNCTMNNYRYQCIVTDGSGGITSGIVTLSVVGCVTVQNGNIALNGNNVFTIPPNPLRLGRAVYQWQKMTRLSWGNITNGGSYTGANTSALTVNVTNYDQHLERYRCMIVVNGVTYYSNEETLRINGGISPKDTNITGINGGTTFFSLIPPGPGYTYQWQVDNGGGYRNILAGDSDQYRLRDGQNPRLTVKNTNPDMNNTTYRCIMRDTTTGSSYISDSSVLSLTGNIAPLKFQVLGAIYSQPKGLDDDNSANLTQTYLRFVIPATNRAKTGIDINSTGLDKFIWFRDLFLQITYSTNVGNLNYVDDSSKTALNISNPNRKYVNRLDLYQYAKFNANFMVPIFTIIGTGRRHRSNLSHFYIDPYVSFLETTVADSPSSKMNVSSLVYGFNATLRFPLIVDNFQMELSTKAFFVNPLNNGINADYNFQYARRADYDKTGNSKSLTARNRPYYNFDGLIIYNTSKDNTGAELFIHYSIFSNLVTGGVKNEKNTFYQLQVGYVTDLYKFAQNLYKTILPK